MMDHLIVISKYQRFGLEVSKSTTFALIRGSGKLRKEMKAELDVLLKESHVLIPELEDIWLCIFRDHSLNDVLGAD